MKYGLIADEGKILCRYEQKTEAGKGGPAILEKDIGDSREFSQNGRN